MLLAVARSLTLPFLLALAVAGVAAQQSAFERRPAALDANPPSARVAGGPGAMTVRSRACRSFPAAAIRGRIIDMAVQEWGFFGFSIVDWTEDGGEEAARPGWGYGRRRGGGDPVEAARVAPSIGGYWAVTPDGPWIVANQNDLWNQAGGVTGRWRYPWSAAFVSWVMCESGLARMDEFRRDVAHHRYIDQAIRSRGAGGGRAAYAAHEAGDTDITPGDLLCTARRPAYRTLAERRRQMGSGARTHCDIVVKVDEPAGRVFAIGGNVRGTVGLKAFPAARTRGVLRIADNGGRPIFAHLVLNPRYVRVDVFDRTAAVRALSCAAGAPAAWRPAAALVASDCGD
jgi:hypothetical protein